MGSDFLIVNKAMLNYFREPTADECARLVLPDKSLYQRVRVKEESKSELGTRKTFTDYVRTWALDDTVIDVNSTNVPTIGTHKPDILTRKKLRGGVQSIREVGEMKSMRDSEYPQGDFSNEEIGQTLDYLQATLTAQPWRIFVYGFLSDCRRFEFFKAMRKMNLNSSEVIFERSGVLMDVAGWSALRKLLIQDETTVGFQDISLTGWDLDSWLGSGNTAFAFLARSQSSSDVAVCKIYQDPLTREEHRRREVTALEKLRDLPHIPKVVPSSPDSTACGLPVLLKTPVGINISQSAILPIASYAPLVKILQIAHDRDVFHNDISPENLFAVIDDGAPSLSTGKAPSESESRTVLLNDFGSACSTDELIKGVKIGTRSMYYMVGNQHRQAFGAIGDLCALVRSVFVITQRTYHPAAIDTAIKLDVVMRSPSQIGFWEVALDCALACNYDSLHDLFLRGGR
jgi:hypothetical protein